MNETLLMGTAADPEEALIRVDELRSHAEARARRPSWTKLLDEPSRLCAKAVERRPDPNSPAIEYMTVTGNGSDELALALEAGGKARAETIGTLLSAMIAEYAAISMMASAKLAVEGVGEKGEGSLRRKIMIDQQLLKLLEADRRVRSPSPSVSIFAKDVGVAVAAPRSRDDGGRKICGAD